jgi:ATP-dependent exoDNAse (exonuclease V) beta subunit
LALTRALLHPADRIAWLALLRAPWCGLSLNDLFILADENLSATFWEQLQKPLLLQKLSMEGQQRLTRILPILQAKIADRHRFSLSAWLKSTWLLLGGPACTEQASDLADTEAYFNLLEQFDKNGELPHLDDLEHAISRLYASPNHQADNTLQIMTIHNAKGLEFDTVILPHLERKSPNDDKQLLLWMERPRPHAHNALLIAPIHAAGQTNDSIYDYIKKQHALKTNYESGRLLYVAATRAKKRLHLFFSLEQDKDKIAEPAHNSLLDQLWHAIAPEIIHPSASRFHKIEYNESSSPLPLAIMKEKKSIRRLTLDWDNPIKEQKLTHAIAYHHQKQGFQLPDNSPKYIGIFLHKILEQLCLQGACWWENASLDKKTQYCIAHLTQLGVSSDHLDATLQKIFAAVKNMLSDPRGQWIIKPHLEANSELQLTAVIENKMKSLAIDRTFVDEWGTRWIIDYKTSAFADGSLETFLNAEQKKYAEQLTHYAKAIRHIDERPIKLGLYFPLIPAWREWQLTDQGQ